MALADWVIARNLIWADGSLNDITEALGKLPQKKIEKMNIKSPDFQHYSWDLMHFAIVSNRKDVIEYMFNKGYFTSACSTRANRNIPYLHVACFYGHTDIFNLIMQHRPTDKNLTVTDKCMYWGAFMENSGERKSFMIYTFTLNTVLSL